LALGTAIFRWVKIDVAAIASSSAVSISIGAGRGVSVAPYSCSHSATQIADVAACTNSYLRVVAQSHIGSRASGERTSHSCATTGGGIKTIFSNGSTSSTTGTCSGTSRADMSACMSFYSGGITQSCMHFSAGSGEGECLTARTDIAVQTVLINANVSSGFSIGNWSQSHAGVCAVDETDLGLCVYNAQINTGIKGAIGSKSQLCYAKIESIKFWLFVRFVGHFISNFGQMVAAVGVGGRSL
jgi:hypothetical protein